VVFATRTTARLYGAPEPVIAAMAPTGVSKIDLEPARRSGLLTQVAFLAANASLEESNPIKRGVALWDGVLCGNMPTAPESLQEQISAELSRSASEREKAETRKANAVCNGCHQFLDPLGFAFERYNAIGAYRLTVAGRPVESSGMVALPTTGPIAFDDAVGLMRRLASAPEVRRCVTRHWFRYALGRQELPEDEGSIDAAHRAAAGGGSLDLRQLVLAIAQSRTFLLRSPSPGEAP
jgi:hypothetical protein